MAINSSRTKKYTTKFCSFCRKKEKFTPKGLRCKKCVRVYSRKHYKKNRKKYIAYSKRWAKENPERIKEISGNHRKNNKECYQNSQLKYLYGIGLKKVKEMKKKQKGRCLICLTSFRKKTPQVDHDHKTGKIRGLLCGKCNRALGLLGDNPTILRTAYEYIRAS